VPTIAPTSWPTSGPTAAPTKKVIEIGDQITGPEDAQLCYDSYPDEVPCDEGGPRGEFCRTLPSGQTKTDCAKLSNTDFESKDYTCGSCDAARRKLESQLLDSNSEDNTDVYIDSVLDIPLEHDKLNSEGAISDVTTRDKMEKDESFWAKLSAKWRSEPDDSEATPSGPHLNGNDAEKPYCVAKDFPCEGKNMVYICHYSPYQGYETLCVHESKTDILAYYENDYCGHCEGGFGQLLHK